MLHRVEVLKTQNFGPLCMLLHEAPLLRELVVFCGGEELPWLGMLPPQLDVLRLLAIEKTRRSLQFSPDLERGMNFKGSLLHIDYAGLRRCVWQTLLEHVREVTPHVHVQARGRVHA